MADHKTLVVYAGDSTDSIPVPKNFKPPTPDELLEEFIQIKAADGSVVTLRTRMIDRLHLK